MIETQIIVKIVKFETANLCFDRKQICGFFLISVQISPSDVVPQRTLIVQCSPEASLLGLRVNETSLVLN